jgi:hypothetical protein
MADLVTVRIPELPPSTTYAPLLSLNDRVPLWMNANNKTVYAELSALRTLVLTGGNAGTVSPPVISGNSVFAIVGVAEDGTDTFNIPSLAGQVFILRREGIGAMKPADYEILNAGGFKIKNGNLLTLGELFELDTYKPAGPLLTSTPTSFLKGVVQVVTNKTLTVADMGKLIQIRGGSETRVLTLPDIAVVPADTIIPIESTINNTAQHEITTTGGQHIYFGNASPTNIWIGMSEMIWLYRGTDGWYVINYQGNFLSVGEIQFSYVAGLNQTVLDGRAVSKESYPRVWSWANSIGGSLVDETTWQTVASDGSRPYQGCFADIDANTFRFPDYQNMFVRGLKPGDTERTLNLPGGMQVDSFKAHDHDLPADGGGTTDRQSLTNTANADEGPNGNNKSASTGGSETRGKNIGGLWTIKI